MRWVLAVAMIAMAGCGQGRVPEPAVQADEARQVATKPEPAPDDGILRVRGVHIVDDQGRTRITMGIDKQGSPSIDIFDTSGVSRVSIYDINESGPKIQMQDAKSNLVVDLPPGFY